MAEWFEKHMIELHRELEREKVWRQKARREHRLEWRRNYYRRKLDETLADAPSTTATAEEIANLIGQEQSNYRRA